MLSKTQFHTFFFSVFFLHIFCNSIEGSKSTLKDLVINILGEKSWKVKLFPVRLHYLNRRQMLTEVQLHDVGYFQNTELCIAGLQAQLLRRLRQEGCLRPACVAQQDPVSSVYKRRFLSLSIWCTVW
jgi:hypothetical protein